MFDLSSISVLRAGVSRSICAENPTGGKASGAQALPTDAGTHPASRLLGRGWKVRPCLRDIAPGSGVVLADIAGPGVVRHVWCTVEPARLKSLTLLVFYDGSARASVRCPLGDFFANGLDGLALVNSAAVAVNPRAGLNSYWPMPFRRGVRIELVNDGPDVVKEFFYQIDYTLEHVGVDAGLFHALWRRSRTTMERPEHVILDGVRGKGHYAGTYMTWAQHAPGWWGEGEVKFFIDGDPPDGPTICGTGTEDYVGGAYCFAMELEKNQAPTAYSTLFLGYPQALIGREGGVPLAHHAMYRWHIPDPVHFEMDLRVTVQALGWWPEGTYRPLTDDIASVAYWYQEVAGLPGESA